MKQRNASIRVADEVWIVTALLHREHPERVDFTVQEIVEKAEAEHITGEPLRSGVKTHVYSHCVANRPPVSGRYRMLFDTGGSRRRLFRPGDACDLERTAAKYIPDEIPPAYEGLIDWYHKEYAGDGGHEATDPILSLRGTGKEVWADEDADAYVNRLRREWA